MNISNSNALKSHHSLTTQEVHLLTSKEGYENLIFTIVLIFLLHLFLSLIFFPVFLTICTNYRYSLSTLNKLSVKLISCLFDIVAVAGAVKELINPEDALFTDPIYGFSSHSQFHFSVASGYFFWASFTTLLFGSKSNPKHTVLPFLHHISCAFIFLFTLRPFLHHYGNVFLMFQGSTLVLDLHSVGRIIGAPSSGTNRTLRIIHPFVFFLVRICIGIPISFFFLGDMFRLVAVRGGHSYFEIAFMVFFNVLINVLNIYWFANNIIEGGEGSTRPEYATGSCSVSVKEKPVRSSVSVRNRVDEVWLKKLTVPLLKAEILKIDDEAEIKGLRKGDLQSLIRDLSEGGSGDKKDGEREPPETKLMAPVATNWFETQYVYKKSSSFSDLKNANKHSPRAAHIKSRTPASLKALRAFLLLAAMVSAFVITRHGNFIVAPSDVRNYSSVLNGDQGRETSAFAAKRAKSKVDDLLGEFRNLTKSIQNNLGTENNKFDVVISGGGFKGQYAGGVLGVFALLEKEGIIEIDRWAGASIGACTAASFATGVDFESFFRVPYAWQGVWTLREFWKGGPVVREMMRQTLPAEDAHVTLSGKLFVSVTTFDGLMPKNELISQFDSKDDLIDALVAGSSIPGFTGEPFLNKWKGKIAMDGGATLNTPIFEDRKNPQIVINLGYVPYATGFTFSPTDPNHEDLSFQGMDDAVGFLTGRGSSDAIHLINMGVEDEGGGGSGGEEGEGVLIAAKELLEDVAHFFYYDIMSWASFTGFGFELIIGFMTTGFFLHSLGVYDDIVY
ncbi:hypothetical protein TrLO_g10656 [Triparma laevis f. longispina]|uniref:PNPLA domain-containing protein n=1 Tax=Triparma laevis f. longispina TaxID=1714387 RepID=A0A9W7E8L9_9STRA|nr:hypothetical protein TrLO_g10656 [Triparma laevis f. longispina]